MDVSRTLSAFVETEFIFITDTRLPAMISIETMTIIIASFVFTFRFFISFSSRVGRRADLSNYISYFSIFNKNIQRFLTILGEMHKLWKEKRKFCHLIKNIYQNFRKTIILIKKNPINKLKSNKKLCNIILYKLLWKEGGHRKIRIRHSEHRSGRCSYKNPVLSAARTAAAAGGAAETSVSGDVSDEVTGS